ncbi:MAG: hypothetical protein K9G40_02345 [Crocinitomicaceae bacterium]|nr:hypothetical protein [Crocinitomicaceae bacterium]
MVKELIDKEYKTREFTRLANQFIEKPSDIAELVEVSGSKEPHPYPEYASWLLIHITRKAPQLIETYQHKFIDTILSSANQSVLRNLLNSCVSLPFIEHEESAFLDRLLDFVKDDTNKVALQVYGLYKLKQFVEKYPEILPEINGILDLKEENNLQPAMRFAIRNFRKIYK